MSSEIQHLIERYLATSGSLDGDRYELAAEEAAWLIQYATRLGGVRLELLRSIQAALPTSEDVSELKELLTNLIIMLTRLAEREESAGELLRQAMASGRLGGAIVDRRELMAALGRLLEACAHVESVAGEDER